MKRIAPKILTLVVAALMLISLMPTTINDYSSPEPFEGTFPEDVMDSVTDPLDTDFNLTNEYQKIWEPNNIRGSTHAIAISEDAEWMATAGGYLNDREVHIYRWIEPMHQYYPIWDAGDGIIQGDVMDVAFMDCDNNGRLEVVAGSADGTIYVFEQLGDADSPFDSYSMAHQWELVWDSGLYIDRQVWSVIAYDIDHDSHDEIIAGAWDGKVYVFDYIDHSAYPYCTDEHWIEFLPVWDSGDTITDRVNSVCVIDSDNDTRMEIVAGSQDNKVYLFEERPCMRDPWNQYYEFIWDSGDVIYAPIVSVTADQNLDDDNFGEIVVSAYGQGVYVFDYNPVTEDFDVRKLNQGIKSWERAISLTTGVYTGYEADEYIDRKVYGWEGQGIIENGSTIPEPYDSVLLGGASFLGGILDDQETTFDSTEQFVFQGLWNFEVGSDFGQFLKGTDIALAPDGTYYIVDYLNDRIVRVDDQMNLLLMWGEEGIEDGQFDAPTGITVDEDGFVYVADNYNNRVQKFDSVGGFLASWGTYGTGDEEFSSVYDVAVWDGKLYASDSNNSRIQVLDAETGEFLYRFGSSGTGNGQFAYPVGLAFDMDGLLYVCDRYNNRVQKFDANGTFVMTFGTYGSSAGKLNQPEFVMVDHDMRIYVADINNHRVQKFSPSGEYESQFGSFGMNPGQFECPYGMALHPSGCILIVDGDNDRIQRFGVQEYELVDTFAKNIYQNSSFDLAFDSEGNYYVTDAISPFIYKYSPSGEYILNWALPGFVGCGIGIAIDESDTVFITNTVTDKVHVFSTTGDLITSFGESGEDPGQIDGPYDVAVDGEFIYISDYWNERISVFDYDYNFVDTFGLWGSGSADLAGPYSVDIGPDGLVYVSCVLNYSIHRFFKNGTHVDYWFNGYFSGSVTFDDEGFVYVTAPYSNAILKYSPDGTLIDVMDYEIGNYELEKYGYLTGYRLIWHSEKQSLYIADFATGKIVIMRPYIALNDIAEAVVDFGQWEEIGGDATPDADLYLFAEDSLDIENLELWISNDLETFVQIELEGNTEYLEDSYDGFGFIAKLGIDVDPTLRNARWDEFRYMRIGVKGGDIINFDCANGTVARPIKTALVVTTGYIHTGNLTDDTLKIIVGTVDGEIMAYDADGTMVWESQSDQPRFSLGTSIWDIVQITRGKGMVPTWVESGSLLTDAQIDYVPNFDKILSYTMVDIDGSSAYDIVATVAYENITYLTMLVYYRNTGTNENPIYEYQPSYFKDHSTLTDDIFIGNATVMMADMDGDYDSDMIICLSSKGIHVLYLEQDSGSWTLMGAIYLNDLDDVLIYYNWLPRIAACDMDYDGDMDLTISLDKLYYFECLDNSPPFEYNLDESVYADINFDKKNETVFGKVAFWDFDLDGDLDIIVPHASENYTYTGYKCETGRFTYWRNTGNCMDYEWTKTRSMFEPDFTGTLLNPERGYDGPEFRDMNGDGLPDLIVMNEDSILLFMATLEHDTFLCATYPYIHMVQVDKRTQSDGYWGFEAYDSWTNWLIFESWSRSLEYGDVDQDGKPEVFVGSFDNNIIAFEQVANNTYRRSWRSPDIFLKNWMSGVITPFQMNIRDMVIGDQDNDGRQELIVCAGYNIYVFEVVENDIYELVWESPTLQFWTDMENKTGDLFPKQPFVVAVDSDLDGDEKPEIIVGAEDYLIFFENTGDNNYTMVGYEIYYSMGDGDPFIYGIMTDDVNDDGARDVIVVGSDRVWTSGCITQEYGWVRFIENQLDADNNPLDNNYVQFHEELPESGAYCVDIANNDLDRFPEIFVGTGDGVNIYEYDQFDSLNFLQILPTVDETKAVRAGNTDGDSWLEVVAGTGKNLTVFEQNQTFDRDEHMYDVVWNSGALHEEITDLRLGDSNVNGRMEIIATARKGYLYSFECIVNSSAIAISPAFNLTADTVSFSAPIQEPMMAVMDSIQPELERMLETLQGKTRRFSTY